MSTVADMPPAVFAFEVWVKDSPEVRSTINERTSSRARSEYLAGVRDILPDIEYVDLRCRKVGPPHTTEGFIRNAKYRGFPNVVCGQRVRVGEDTGVIVGYFCCCNFEVLFDGDSPKYADQRLNVHPSDVVLLEQES